ncbi:FeoB-associated Cys-rich membrane protein [Fusobacterium sp.]|uniref:FeoB-associated Cys-rich membrane protein n=1 Tax=Fusobacterium sp. TaxID=68766 RepID=UPI0028FE48E9|nr:FeoB-associated Cys-rich membrane protein [Fusobacterium sp.]MDU1910864.1 FeoB-associated Cys-rich membrane protein [Fusobacterium sp.]
MKTIILIIIVAIIIFYSLKSVYKMLKGESGCGCGSSGCKGKGCGTDGKCSGHEHK